MINVTNDVITPLIKLQHIKGIIPLGKIVYKKNERENEIIKINAPGIIQSIDNEIKKFRLPVLEVLILHKVL